MQIYQIQKTKNVFSLVGPATDCHARCTNHVLYMFRLEFDLRTVYNVCMHALCYMYVVWDQTGSKLMSCDWPSFKMNRLHVAYDFPLEFQWENKETHKFSVTEGSRLLFDFERVRGRNAQTYTRLCY